MLHYRIVALGFFTSCQFLSALYPLSSLSQQRYKGRYSALVPGARGAGGPQPADIPGTAPQRRRTRDRTRTPGPGTGAASRKHRCGQCEPHSSALLPQRYFRMPRDGHPRGAAQGSPGVPVERHKAAPHRQEAPSAAASLHPERRGQRGPAGGRTRPRPRGIRAGHPPTPGPRTRPGPPTAAPSPPPSGCPAGLSFSPRSPDEPRQAAPPAPPHRSPRRSPGPGGGLAPGPEALAVKARLPPPLPPARPSHSGCRGRRASSRPAPIAALAPPQQPQPGRGNGEGNRPKTQQKQRHRPCYF
ncbi:basic proline-rich protein-like [Melozone crissalis]|uniref:basic proline-rich protein-like n=1 Tax=Melozone crissalis TaxID=40204 RepID=UPI0023DC5232|nr:basic proline-rich protein-like [Melozone crissalis]